MIALIDATVHFSALAVVHGENLRLDSACIGKSHLNNVTSSA